MLRGINVVRLGVNFTVVVTVGWHDYVVQCTLADKYDSVPALSFEADQIIGDLVERARLAGIETPLLAAIYTHLCVYQRRVLA